MQRIQVLKMYHAALDDGCFLITEQTQKMPAELNGYFEQVVANAQIFRKIPGMK